MRIPIEQRFCRYQNPRRAIAALRRAEVGKGILQGVQPSIGAEPFDRQDSSSRALERKNEARKHRLAIQENRAGAAFSQLAAMFRPGVEEIFAQDLQQGFVRSEQDVDFFAIQREPDLRGLL